MNRAVLLLLYLVLWLSITIADVLERRTLSARLATFFAWLWIGFLALGLLGSTAEKYPSIAPVLACCSALIFGIAVLAYREPTNLSPRFAFLMMVGSGGATVAMIAVVATTGSAIVDPARHARAWVGLLFLDVTLGLPVLVSLADRTMSPGFIARLLERRGQRLAAAPQSHAGSSLLPRATERFSTLLSPDAIRQALAKLTVPLGKSPPGSPPTYRGVIPSDGSFSLTRYVYQVNRYGRGRYNPITMDIDLSPAGHRSPCDPLGRRHPSRACQEEAPACGAPWRGRAAPCSTMPTAPPSSAASTGAGVAVEIGEGFKHGRDGARGEDVERGAVGSRGVGADAVVRGATLELSLTQTKRPEPSVTSCRPPRTVTSAAPTRCFSSTKPC